MTNSLIFDRARKGGPYSRIVGMVGVYLGQKEV